MQLDLRFHLEKSFLEQGRALLKFEAQWKDLKNEHTRENEQRQVQLQQMGFPILSLYGTEHFATANPNASWWSNTSPRPSGNGPALWSNTMVSPSGNVPAFWSNTWVRPSGNGPAFSSNTWVRPSGNSPAFWSNTAARPSGTGPALWINPTARPPGNGPSGNGAPKLHCDVCNIYCDTKAVLDKHKMGKKHKANLEKLKGKTIPGQSSNRRPVNPPAEDLDTKRRKVLESGAAPHALRTCSLCNVVCLSVSDFNNHRSGQRHAEAAAMAKRNGAGTSGQSQLQRRF